MEEGKVNTTSQKRAKYSTTKSQDDCCEWGFYRVVAGCTNKLIMNWAQEEQCLPDSQFGFVPGRSIIQAAFLLRHCVEAAKAHGEELHSVFVDFLEAAYDTVDRGQLFRHLHGLGLPAQLLHLLENIYRSSVYMLVDGDKQAEVEPQRGVKQGCPISPTLFALYIRPISSTQGS